MNIEDFVVGQEVKARKTGVIGTVVEWEDELFIRWTSEGPCQGNLVLIRNMHPLIQENIELHAPAQEKVISPLSIAVDLHHTFQDMLKDMGETDYDYGIDFLDYTDKYWSVDCGEVYYASNPDPRNVELFSFELLDQLEEDENYVRFQVEMNSGGTFEVVFSKDKRVYWRL